MTPPDYLGIGAVGSRNRWWHLLLLEHPQVRYRAPDERALYFFQRFCTREMTDADVAEYHGRFRRGRGEIDGEWTQRYLYDPWVAPLIARAAPEARLLMLLPDPVERYRRKLSVDRPHVEEHEEGYWLDEVAARGRYASQLRHLFEYVPRERVLVLQYEQCRAQPAQQFARTLRFLGLDEDWEPAGGWRSPSPAPPPSASVRRTLGLARRRLLGRPLPEPPRRGPVRGATEPDSPMADLWPDIEGALRAELVPEADDLVELVEGIDLDLWPCLQALR